jgi:hypothetical protein
MKGQHERPHQAENERARHFLSDTKKETSKK